MSEHYFAKNGLLAQKLEGFAPRLAQQQMAKALDECLQQQNVLLVEAGTGTGKTFAYLVPALSSGKKVVISTGSKALQDQLYFKDLPRVVKALDFHEKVALLKGRSNYLCKARLDSFATSDSGQDKQTLTLLSRVKAWELSSKSGDISELGPLAERREITELITSTNDNCLGRECPDYQECYLVKARANAMEAQLVVVNHHLFFADLAVKGTGFGEIIPEAQAYIFDEAHQLPDIATSYFGEQLSSRQLLDLCKDCLLAYQTELKDMAQLQKAVMKLERQVRESRLCFEGQRDRGDWRALAKQNKFAQSMQRLREDLNFVYQVLKIALGRSELADACFERVSKLNTALGKLLAVDQTGFSYWYELSRLHFTLHLTPLNVAERFREELDKRDAAWVFTSATLAVDGRFRHFSGQLGLSENNTLLLDSPFDYPKQSLLCVPRYLPETRDPKAEQMMLDQLLPLIEQNKGQCFFLCTSHNMTTRVAHALRERSELNILLQGEESKQMLLQRFVKEERSVLVATASFWEGVDVPGDALSLVIIDKLPFAAPDEPLLQAKSEDCRLRGGDPFTEVYLPQAAIALKQGVGRLIRDVNDRGVVVICDNRLVNRHYGAMLLASLPNMPRTRDIEKVMQFIREKHG